MSRWVLVPVVVMVAACSSSEMALRADNALGTSTPSESRAVTGLRLDVISTDLPADGDTLVLPQSEPIDGALEVGVDRDLGAVELVEPVRLEGQVVGRAIYPLRPAADLPGDDTPAPVTGELRVLHTTALQSYRLPLDTDGRFATVVVPEPDYLLAIVPDTPALPLTFSSLDLTRDQIGLEEDIGSGAPVYGMITQDGLPLAGAAVVLEQEGVVSAQAVSGPQGYYEIRAQPGSYTVRCLGRETTGDPVLTVDEVVLESSGIDVDFDYPTLDRFLVEGSVSDSEGRPLDQPVTVQLTSRTLDGLGSQAAALTVDVPATGTFLVRAPAGTYDLDVLPPAVEGGTDHTPLRLESLVVASDTDVGALPLPALRPVAGSVADTSQQLVPGVAVACREEGFGRRSWSTVTDADGRFALDLPQVPVVCALTPPADRADVALTRRRFDPADNASPTLELARGQTLTGRVRRDGEGEGFVLVELRDDEGELLGSALTDDDGEYALQVDLQGDAR